MLQTTFEQF